MQKIFDDYLKAATVLFVCVAALLSARVATQLAASMMWTPRSHNQASEVRTTPAIRPETEADFQIIARRNLFNDSPPAPGVSTGDRPPIALPEPPPTMDFTLVATVVQSKSASFAVFSKGDTTLIRRPGMEISPGITLVEVHKEKVVVLLGKEKKDIDLFTDKPADTGRRRAARYPQPPAPQPQAAQGDNENIKQIGDNSWAIDRKEVDGALANLSTLITQLRVIPNLVDGQTQGFRVFNIRPGSVFSQIGLLDGDIIREVNGTPLTGIDVAYQAMNGLSSQTSLQVRIDRGNQPMTLSYEIR